MRDPEKWLEKYSFLLQETRSLPPLCYSDMDNVRRFRDHVDQLSKAGSILQTFPFPVNVEYQQKAGLVLVSSGSLAALCDCTETLLQLTQTTSLTAELSHKYQFLKKILMYLAFFTDHDAAVCKAVQSHQKLVPALLTRLEEWRDEYLKGDLLAPLTTIICIALIIVHNMASFEECLQYLRELPDVVRVVQEYTKVTEERTRVAALTTMAELVTEEDVVMLATDSKLVRFILQQLKEALNSTSAYSSLDWEATELIRAIVILAKNEDNKKLLVKEGVLASLESVLKCTNYDIKDCKRCQESTRAMLCLMTVEQHKDKLVQNEGLLDCVVNIYRDEANTHTKECFETAQKVIASLLGKLEALPKYKRVAFQIRRGQTCEVYTMSSRPRGHCLIINNRDFSYPPDTRTGTDVDKDKLEQLFLKMNFTITIQHNLTASDMERSLRNTAGMDHQCFDLFICCILSHGHTGCVYGVDGVTVQISDLTAPFNTNSCPSLAGKPKLFFIQACQGLARLEGVEQTQADVIADNITPGYIPNEADFLLGYCTVPGNVAYRHVREGSWYISALCEVLDIHSERQDILDILTMVNKEVAEKIHRDARSVFQQVPAPMYTLTKKLIFGKS